MAKSIIQTEQECYLCHTTKDLQVHHCICGTANRKKSEQFGLKVYLCAHHHRLAHSNLSLHWRFLILGQKAFEDEYGDREEFIKLFGRNYLGG